MSGRSWIRVGARCLAGTVLLVVLAPTASAQTEPDTVEVEPLTCWWRTTTGSVRVGESFSVILTCSLLQTAAARVLLDESRLDPSVVQLPPFEILGGARATDRAAASRRFLQYTYTLRVITETAFGSDVLVPPLQLSYRIESRVNSSSDSSGFRPDQGRPEQSRGTASSGSLESIQGRDLTYVLPPLSIRMVSLVPDNATDIREAPVATFGEIEAAGFRATALRVVAVILLLLGALVFLLGLIGYLRRGQAATSKTSIRASNAAILGAVRRALADVQDRSRESGWTNELAGRALTPLRITAAYTLRRPLNQVAGDLNVAPKDGQLVVKGTRGTSLLISAPVAVDGASEMPAELRTGLARFTALRYGRTSSHDATALDDSIHDALRIVDQLAANHTWVSEAHASVKRSLAELRGRVWAR